MWFKIEDNILRIKDTVVILRFREELSNHRGVKETCKSKPEGGNTHVEWHVLFVQPTSAQWYTGISSTQLTQQMDRVSAIYK